ncbi:aminotransferase class V-fold PLP-dependent enzyme [Nocardioides pocheonensis]|uniref:Probable hercynylcysteine sulfoxide lyase n=1 Tax=Nocardioides pocheonensis TaxID=661485 RepID=A0A3N0GQJ0_9ACTN|nr:aminotransferase class V-fold PLP-dependent enzyme [Nocardioides pocheonensis]
MIDLSAARAETPGCLDRVFLDSAGSSLPTTRVLETVVGHLRREAEVGGYRAAAEREAELAAVPESVGRLLGCDPDLVALTDSATRAWDLFVTALPWSAGDRVLVCGTEYASNAIALLQRARLDGCVVEIVPNDDRGLVDLAALEAVLDERVRLVSLVHVPTNSGQVAPVREVVELAHRAGALVLLDACQSVGQLAVDVEELGVDALSATGRKWLRAPRGTGFLHVRREVLEALEPASADLRGASWTGSHDYELAPGARRFELWEYDVAARLGLKVAVDQLLDLGVADVEAAVRSRADDLRRGLDDLERVTVRDVGPDLSGIVSFTVDGLRAEEVRDRLADQRVTVTVSGAASTRLDMAERGLEAVVRASPHYFVSPGDVQRAVEAVAGLA